LCCCSARRRRTTGAKTPRKSRKLNFPDEPADPENAHPNSVKKAPRSSKKAASSFRRGISVSQSLNVLNTGASLTEATSGVSCGGRSPVSTRKAKAPLSQRKAPRAAESPQQQAKAPEQRQLMKQQQKSQGAEHVTPEKAVAVQATPSSSAAGPLKKLFSPNVTSPVSETLDTGKNKNTSKAKNLAAMLRKNKALLEGNRMASPPAPPRGQQQPQQQQAGPLKALFSPNVRSPLSDMLLLRKASSARGNKDLALLLQKGRAMQSRQQRQQTPEREEGEGEEGEGEGQVTPEKAKAVAKAETECHQPAQAVSTPRMGGNFKAMQSPNTTSPVSEALLAGSRQNAHRGKGLAQRLYANGNARGKIGGGGVSTSPIANGALLRDRLRSMSSPNTRSPMSALLMGAAAGGGNVSNQPARHKNMAMLLHKNQMAQKNLLQQL
jgi:hypothetical protein